MTDHNATSLAVDMPASFSNEPQEHRAEIEGYLKFLHPGENPAILVAYKAKAPRLNSKGASSDYDGHGLHGIADAVTAVLAAEAVKAKTIWCSAHKPKTEAPGWAKKWFVNNMDRYQFLALDFDNKVKDGEEKDAEDKEKYRLVCATDEERKQVREKLKQMKAELATFGQPYGLPTPTTISTGNGYMALYPIDLEVNKETRELMARLAKALAKVYSTANQDLDTGVIQDPSRILGVVGTTNRNKAEVPEEGRIAKRRAVVGDYGPREPMPAEAFTAFATAFCDLHDPAADCVRDVVEAPSSPAPAAPDASKPPVPTSESTPRAVDEANATDCLRTAATRYLAKCEAAQQGDKGDGRTFNLAGHLLAMRFGRADGPRLSETEVLDLMLTSDWNRRCSPPWTREELIVKVNSAAKNGTPRDIKILGDRASELGPPDSMLADNAGSYEDDSTGDFVPDWALMQRNPKRLILKASDLSLPRNIQIVATHLSKLTNHRNTSALLLTLWAMSAIAGKKVHVKIGECDYKTALRTIDLDRSSSGKSPALRTAVRWLSQYADNVESINSCTVSSFFESRASKIVRPKGEDDAIGKNFIVNQKRELLGQYRKKGGSMPLYVDDGMSFINNMTLYRSKTGDFLAQWCQLLDDDECITYETKNGGLYYIGDPCVPLYINAPPDTFADFQHNHNAFSAGAVARLLQCNAWEINVEFDDLGMTDADIESKADEVMRAFRCLCLQADDIRVDDLPLDNRSETEIARMPELSLQVKVWSQSDILKRFMSSMAGKAAISKAKAAVQAKKMAALMAVAEAATEVMVPGASGDPFTMRDPRSALQVSASHLYAGSFNWTWHCLATALMAAPTASQEGDDLDKVTLYARRVLADHQKTKNHKLLSKLTLASICRNVRVGSDNAYQSKSKRVNELVEVITNSGWGGWVNLPNSRGRYLFLRADAGRE